jgi:multisubunit Na+/H+ antiporter MnhG subunit
VTWQAVLSDVFLGAAVLVVAASALGIGLMGDAYQRVHFVTPIGLVAPVFVALSVSVRDGLTEQTAQVWLVVVILWIAGPVLSHATVRAARVRERGDWRDREGVVQPKEET